MSKEEPTVIGMNGKYRVVQNGPNLTLEYRTEDALGNDTWVWVSRFNINNTSHKDAKAEITMATILAGHAEEVKQLYETNFELRAHLNLAELAIGQAMQWLGEWHKAVADKDEDALACAELLLYKEAGFAAPNPMPGQEG